MQTWSLQLPTFTELYYARDFHNIINGVYVVRSFYVRDFEATGLPIQPRSQGPLSSSWRQDPENEVAPYMAIQEGLGFRINEMTGIRSPLGIGGFRIPGAWCQCSLLITAIL